MAIGDKKPVVMQSDKALPGGVASLGADGKIPVGQLPVIPVTNGGTGASNAKSARSSLGLNTRVNTGPGEQMTLTLPTGNSYLICCNDNIHGGCLLVTMGNSGIQKVTELSRITNCTYTYEGNILTLVDTYGVYGLTVLVSTIACGQYSDLYLGEG